MTGRVGKFTSPRSCGIRRFMKPRISLPSAFSETEMKRRLEAWLQHVLSGRNYAFQALDEVLYIILISTDSLLKLIDLISKCRKWALYFVKADLNSFKFRLHVRDHIKLHLLHPHPDGLEGDGALVHSEAYCLSLPQWGKQFGPIACWFVT